MSRPSSCRSQARLTGLCCCVLLAGWSSASAHERTRPTFEQQLALAQATADRQAESVAAEDACSLNIDIFDSWTKKSAPGLVRITNLATGKYVKLDGEFHRAMNWFSLDSPSTVRVPRGRLRIEAMQGLRTETTRVEIDVTAKEEATVKVPLREFYATAMRGIYSGNTHLHLMNLTHAEADRYLRVVPRSDNLDLVFLSYLRRLPDERNYISNQIVENSFTGGDLERLSQEGVLFGNGEEHRHNFGRGGEGYGHVMLLDLQKLIRPVSIGPGIMGTGTDGRPLRTGIQTAHDDGATVIWCHNKFGHEDVPNWVQGLVHAQNIFDGGDHGSFADSFYRYLNIGLHVPFSTGTDWSIYDFSRVYVRIPGEFSTQSWLEGLRQGHTFITNGPFLEMETERAPIGGTLDVPAPNAVTVVGRGMGRADFKGLELIYNGKVAHRVESKKVDRFYGADFRHRLEIDQPGWFALRIPLDAGNNELGRPLFAHTSPIYVELAGKRIFDLATADEMIDEMQASWRTIEAKAKFGDQAEMESVERVYQEAISKLMIRIQRARAATAE